MGDLFKLPCWEISSGGGGEAKNSAYFAKTNVYAAKINFLFPIKINC